MAPCVCAPSGHTGSFRCRQHRLAARSVASDHDNRSTVSQASTTCLCAPTSHPGSFRCRLHRTQEANWEGRPLLPSAHAKSLRNSELPPAKSGDSVGLKKAAFARTNRAISESKLRSELNKAMPEIVVAVEDLRISPGPVEILTKNGKLIVAPVPEAAMARASNSIDQENDVPSDAVIVKGSTETINILRSQTKGAKRPTSSKDRRLRAKSDMLLANML